MSPKNDTKKKPLPRNYHILRVLLSDANARTIGFERKPGLDPTILNSNLTEALIRFLQDESKRLTLLTKYAKELATTDLRSRQLHETKEVVYSLRETDSTSDEALDFLQEKLTFLQTEREDHDMNILVMIEALEQIQSQEALLEDITSFVRIFTFINTDTWEDDLDYFRTRFLLQREQEEDDQRLKEEFIPEIDATKQSKVGTSHHIRQATETEYFFIAIHKKYYTKLRHLIQEYNQIKLVQHPDSSVSLEEKSEAELEELITQQEKVSFTVGREMYTLKREQGILTLKTYELVQTIKSRLLNITGSIASRRFMKTALNDLLVIVNDSETTFETKMEKITKDVKRLLRIVRKEPSEGK
ncbi:MAG: hypothetical protein ACTSQK_09900 [Candidatus Heimdallarchaeota archaeon]